jgi:nucleoside-diphosphate-sugar epimerase
MSRRVFVAGATGLAGSSIVARLLKLDDVTISAAHHSGGGVFLDDPRITYVRGDLRNQDDCKRMVAGADLAILAAAQSGGAQEAASAPWRQVTDNVVMDTLLLDALHSAGVPRAVFVSSATVYPEQSGFIKEDDLDWNVPPPDAYLGIGYAKRAAESLCRFWHQRTGMAVIVARSSNIFGPYAKFDPARSNFIPALIRKAVDRQDPFEVWGSPDVARDVIYSEDFADAIVALALADEIRYDIFNVGSGQITTVGDVVRVVLGACNYASANVRWLQDKPTTIGFRALDRAKLTAQTGWAPTVGIEEGIQRTARWWQENQKIWTR